MAAYGENLMATVTSHPGSRLGRAERPHGESDLGVAGGGVSSWHAKPRNTYANTRPSRALALRGPGEDAGPLGASWR
jgi:hypothetical protein